MSAGSTIRIARLARFLRRSLHCDGHAGHPHASGRTPLLPRIPAEGIVTASAAKTLKGAWSERSGDRARCPPSAGIRPKADGGHRFTGRNRRQLRRANEQAMEQIACLRLFDIELVGSFRFLFQPNQKSEAGCRQLRADKAGEPCCLRLAKLCTKHIVDDCEHALFGLRIPLGATSGCSVAFFIASGGIISG